MHLSVPQVAVLQLGQRVGNGELRLVAVLLRVKRRAGGHLDVVLEELNVLLGNVEHRAALVFRHRVRLDRRHHVLGEVSPQRAPHVGDRSEGVQRAVEHRHEA